MAVQGRAAAVELFDRKAIAGRFMTHLEGQPAC
jgi:hypothetical protein